MSKIELPIDRHMPEILRSLSEQKTLILQAEPGSGKTTRFPAALMQSVQGGVLVVEPRRLAARLAAERVASELGEACGEQVGYAIRFERKMSAATRLLFITEGLFLRMLASDPLLKKFDYIILDEFHERNIYADLALMLSRRLQQQRPELGVVVMSATLAADELHQYLAPCGVLDIAGRRFPVTSLFIGEQTGRDQAHVSDEAITAAVDRMRQDPRCSGHILVFLVGIGQIYRIRDRLAASLPREWEVLPLAADLPLAQQQAVFKEQGRRKIILATNVAETSVTIPGVTGVIDPGLAKIAGHAPWSGMPTLDIKAVSQASSIQRAGRAGRTAAGLVFHLFDEVSYRRRPATGTPDIERLDFTPYLLELLSLGGLQPAEQGDLVANLPWFERPPLRLFESARRTLSLLGALSPEGQVTAAGREMVAIPLHPRLAALVRAGRHVGCAEDALLAACVLSEGRVADTYGQRDDEAGACDITWQLTLIKQRLFSNRQRPSDKNRRLQQPLDEARLARVLRLYKQLALKAGYRAEPSAEDVNSRLLALCLLHAYPDRVGKRRQPVRKSGERPKGGPSKLYHFCLGRGGMLAASSTLKLPDYILAIEASEDHSRTGATAISVTVGSTIDLATLLKDPAGLVREETRQEVDASTGKTVSYLCRFYGELLLSQERLAEAVQWTPETLAAFVQENWPAPFADAVALTRYHAKLDVLEKAGIAHNLPRFEGEMFSLFCEAMSDEATSPAQLAEKPLERYLAEQLSYEQEQLLARATPDQVKTPAGKQLKVHYETAAEPWVEGFIQDFFGSARSLTIAEGRVILTAKLKGPNRRDCQVTSDLASFWTQAYPELRRQFLRRYPRHHWPEDPVRARPVLFAKQASVSS